LVLETGANNDKIVKGYVKGPVKKLRYSLGNIVK